MTTTILTVDDSPTMLDMLAVTLRTAGYEVVQAENGQKGLDALKSTEVDIIITDINMPVMDGFTFIEKLREDHSNLATPVLILTTESSQEKKQKGRAAGATGWIVKPFDPTKLLEVVRRVSH
jgi:two-component system chemotaxis response regulator CheY